MPYVDGKYKRPKNPYKLTIAVDGEDARDFLQSLADVAYQLRAESKMRQTHPNLVGEEPWDVTEVYVKGPESGW